MWGKKINKTRKATKEETRKNSICVAVLCGQQQRARLSSRKRRAAVRVRPRAKLRPISQQLFQFVAARATNYRPKWLLPCCGWWLQYPRWRRRRRSRRCRDRPIFRIRDRQPWHDVLRYMTTCEWHIWCEINETRKKTEKGNPHEATVWLRLLGLVRERMNGRF